MKRVRCCERNCTFSYERESHNKVCRSCLAFFCSKLVFEKQRGNGNRYRRYHTAYHNRSHDVVVSCSDRCCTEDVCSFINRAAHIDRHHAAENDTENDTACAGHSGKCVVKERVECTHRRLNHERHEQPGDQNADERIDQNGFKSVKRFGKFCEEFLQKQYEITGGKTRDHGSDDAALSLTCNDSADKTDCKTGAVGDAHCDESCKYRKHETECAAADCFEYACNRRDGTE